MGGQRQPNRSIRWRWARYTRVNSNNDGMYPLAAQLADPGGSIGVPTEAQLYARDPEEFAETIAAFAAPGTTLTGFDVDTIRAQLTPGNLPHALAFTSPVAPVCTPKIFKGHVILCPDTITNQISPLTSMQFFDAHPDGRCGRSCWQYKGQFDTKARFLHE